VTGLPRTRQAQLLHRQ